jgi:hypothetical protein
VTPLYQQKLALTSPTGGGRSVGIVRSRTKATELVNVREKNASINGPLVRQKTEELAKTMDKETVSATNGWYKRWKTQENIV